MRINVIIECIQNNSKFLMCAIYILLSTFGLSMPVVAQPRNLHYEKENDFFMNVIYNPTFSIYDFLTVGLNSKNTDLKELHIYQKSKNATSQCRKLKINMTIAYNKVKASWKVFKEVENTDLSSNGFGKYMMSYSQYNIFAPKNCPNPELKHKLSIVPLKLEIY